MPSDDTAMVNCVATGQLFMMFAAVYYHYFQRQGMNGSRTLTEISPVFFLGFLFMMLGLNQTVLTHKDNRLARL